jgi:3-phenylpropionate/cinnamic acid dioxygenase small subunit
MRSTPKMANLPGATAVTEESPEGDNGLQRLLLTHEVTEFLYKEADLLDQRRFDEWLELFTEDTHYWMPMRQNIPLGQEHRENTSDVDGISWFDEGKTTLKSRVEQIKTGLHWAEEPLSRVCHLVSNVRVLKKAATEINVGSRMLVYRNRLQDETDFFVGRREDLLRKVEGKWKIANRKIILDQNVMLAKNVTIFF